MQKEYILSNMLFGLYLSDQRNNHEKLTILRRVFQYGSPPSLVTLSAKNNLYMLSDILYNRKPSTSITDIVLSFLYNIIAHPVRYFTHTVKLEYNEHV